MKRDGNDSDRLRALSLMVGTAIQHSVFRVSNLVLCCLFLLGLAFLPGALHLPLVFALFFSVGSNIFLGASDERLLSDIFEQFTRQGVIETLDSRTSHDCNLIRPVVEPGELSGFSRDIYQKALRLRGDLSRQLRTGADTLPGIDIEGTESRLDDLIKALRSLAAKHAGLERVVSGQSREKLLSEAGALREKAAEAAGVGARESFLAAAGEKESCVASVDAIKSGMEDIEAKLEHVVSSIEAYKTRMVALAVQGRVAGSGDSAPLDEIMTSLEEETEDLEQALKQLESW